MSRSKIVALIIMAGVIGLDIWQLAVSGPTPLNITMLTGSVLITVLILVGKLT